jgi:hypothetical protein
VDCDEYREAARAFAEVMIQRNSIEAAPERRGAAQQAIVRM